MSRWWTTSGGLGDFSDHVKQEYFLNKKKKKSMSSSSSDGMGEQVQGTTIALFSHAASVALVA